MGIIGYHSPLLLYNHPELYASCKRPLETPQSHQLDVETTGDPCRAPRTHLHAEMVKKRLGFPGRMVVFVGCEIR